jgi:Interferon-induced transmembrane protein/zinc-ribbon domain
MFCKSCGAPNDDHATKCSKCGAGLGSIVAPAGQPVPNYLVFAILTTVFCCLPFGIVSIVYAAQVNSRVAGGDHLGALEASSKAKTWAIVSLLCGIVPIGFYVISMILFAVSDVGPAVNH